MTGEKNQKGWRFMTGERDSKLWLNMIYYETRKTSTCELKFFKNSFNITIKIENYIFL